MTTYPNMKFRIRDEAHSEAIQSKLFELGYSWYGGTTVKRACYPSLFTYSDSKCIKHGLDGFSFTDHPNVEHILLPSGEIVLSIDEEGYTRWGGGHCPVPKGTLVRVKYRDGDSGTFEALSYRNHSLRDASEQFWRNESDDDDIVAYYILPSNSCPEQFPLKETVPDQFSPGISHLLNTDKANRLGTEGCTKHLSGS